MVNAGNGSVLQTDAKFPGGNGQTKCAKKKKKKRQKRCQYSHHVSMVYKLLFGSVKLSAAHTRVTPEKCRSHARGKGIYNAPHEASNTGKHQWFI